MKRALLVALAIVVVVPAAFGSAAADNAKQRSRLRLVLDKPLEEGGTTRVRLENRGDVAYRYNSEYQACDMVYRDSAGRRFLVPEGTHCDLILIENIEPGETVTLFEWDLDECVEDNWGCMKAGDLRAGRYSITGTFRPADGGSPVTVTTKFRIRRR